MIEKITNVMKIATALYFLYETMSEAEWKVKARMLIALGVPALLLKSVEFALTVVATVKLILKIGRWAIEKQRNRF